jgi:hypothetical protein
MGSASPPRALSEFTEEHRPGSREGTVRSNFSVLSDQLRSEPADAVAVTPSTAAVG